MRHHSLLRRLIRRLLASGAVLMVLNAVLVSVYYGHDADELRRESASRQIAALADDLVVDTGGAVRLPADSSALALFTANPGAYAHRIVDGNGQLVSEVNAAIAPDALRASFAGPDLWMDRGEAGGRSVLTVSQKVTDRSPVPVRITFASVGDPAGLVASALLDELFVHVIVSLLPFAFCLLLVMAITVHRSLAPLTAVAAAARRAGRGRGVGELPTDGLPSEILPLVVAINDALRRLDSVLESERAFTAEAAHALRTPLAVLSARIGTLPPFEGSGSVAADIEALNRLVHQLLTAAQADTLVLGADQSCDLAETARSVVADMAPLAIRRNRMLAFEGSNSLPVWGDRDALAHALRNLVENALRYTPPGSEVIVRAVPTGSVHVLDRGPGIPFDRRDLALKRFWRSSASDLGGTGLGLPIVKRIMDAHDATLVLAERDGGGLEVTLSGFRPG